MTGGGTRCLDQVRYRPRGGTLIQCLFVRRDVERIFQYRQQWLKAMFGSRANHALAVQGKALAGSR